MGTITVSKPAGGGTYFNAGEKITFTVTATDADGDPVDINSTNLSIDRLHIYGPLDQSKTETRYQLMSKSGPSDYIHLLGPETGLTVSGNVATFVSATITSEPDGTYRAVAWLRSKTDDYGRTLVAEEFQVGTATREAETVALTQCASCHKGADNGHHYFHHSDSSSGGLANYEIDDLAIASCKACHNQNGYARTTDSWVSGRTRTADPIIRRVHGVHMGEELKSPRNTHRMALASVTPSTTNGFNPTDARDPTSTPVRLIKGQTSGAEARVISSDGSTYFALGHVTGEFEIGETVLVRRFPYLSGTTTPDLTKTSYSNSIALGTAVVAASTIYGSSSNSSVAVAEGYFADYTTVVFPPDVRKCTVCHIDDNWKDKPSFYACSACHDNIWWGDENATPEGFKNHPVEIGDIKNKVAGCEHNVGLCAPCHNDTNWAIADAHKVSRFVAEDQHTPVPEPAQPYTVELALSPTPTAGYYVAGETPPKVFVTVKNSAGTKVDPATITQAGWAGGLSLFVSGPRGEHATPVLTSAAKGMQISVTNGTAGNWNLSGDPTLEVAINGTPYTLTAASSNFATPASATAAEVVTWLNNATDGSPDFNTVAKAVAASGSKATIKTKVGVAGAKIEILPSTVATQMGWTVGVTYPSGSTAGNDLRIRTDSWDADARVTHNEPDKRIEYQLDDVAGVTNGTYAVYVNGYKSARPDAFALVTFQVGTATQGKHIAKNCTDCHGTKLMHLDGGGRHPAEFNTDYCRNCHDYRPDSSTSVTASTYSVWTAYGADPIVKKVHGVHRGHYLDYPDTIYPNNPIWSGIIFPQDVRNCTKCHSSDTTGTWNTKPSRLACGSCHDSALADIHMSLGTWDATPTYDATTKTGGAYSGDEIETCTICHGEGRDFEAKKVHDISDPYVPPYAR